MASFNEIVRSTTGCSGKLLETRFGFWGQSDDHIGQIRDAFWNCQRQRGLEIITTTTLELDKKTYGQLLGRALPHVIHTEEECERLTNESMRLDELTDSSPEEKELAELLTVLIDEYETRRYPIPKASPRQTLRHLMEARDLTQKDLWKVLGSRGPASEVFHGKRAISRTQAKKLADFFHVGVELFI